MERNAVLFKRNYDLMDLHMYIAHLTTVNLYTPMSMFIYLR